MENISCNNYCINYNNAANVYDFGLWISDFGFNHQLQIINHQSSSIANHQSEINPLS
jgi:hypothetical protein